MPNKWDNSAHQMCREASATGKITRTSVNLLARTFALLGDATAATVRGIDKAIVQGTIKIIEDGDSILDHPKRR